jgi:hypothetical protein
VPSLNNHPQLSVYNQVQQTGQPNYLCAKIPLKSGLKMNNWKKYLASDPQHSAILAYLEFGFPINYTFDHPPRTEITNHSSALKYPKHVSDHIELELAHQAMLGPFQTPPFMQWTHVSPLMSREKKGSESRRIITDMSWPVDHLPPSDWLVALKFNLLI